MKLSQKSFGRECKYQITSIYIEIKHLRIKILDFFIKHQNIPNKKDTEMIKIIKCQN